jgi:putative flippase GtrA
MHVVRGDLVRFVFVGSLGFLIDFGILAALVHGANWNPFLSRALAMTTAGICTWWLHRHWTFASGRLRSAVSQSLLYASTQLIGLSTNYGIFSALVLTGGMWRNYPVLAAAVGSLSAAVITYVLSKWIAFAEPATRKISNT